MNKRTTLSFPEKHWQGRYWGIDGAVWECVRTRWPLIAEDETRLVLVGIASTHYSAANSAFRSQRFLVAVVNALFAYCCARGALVLVGIEGLTANQLDVIQSCLRRLNPRSELALECILRALKYRQPVPHTEALLRVGQAQVYLARGDKRHAGECAERARHIVVAHGIDVSDPRQASRIFRHCGTVFRAVGNMSQARECFDNAEACARRGESKDQLAKVERIR